MSIGWIDDALAALPGTEDVLFQKLWKERRLLFDGRNAVEDTVDYCSARLIAAALRGGERLLLTLPDFGAHRPAFLFATALIRHYLDSRATIGARANRIGPILYFGPTVGIRDQLRRTSVRPLQLNLAEVFSQVDITRGAVDSGGLGVRSAQSGLPRVVTVYSPADPSAVIRGYKPCWIAIDCGDAGRLPWLKPLLEEVARQRIPTIAWGQNALSECIADFALVGKIFSWPPTIYRAGRASTKLTVDPHALLQASDSICLTPFVLHSEAIDAFSASLREATQCLGRVVPHLNGRFENDAVAVHWKYLRSLEGLPVPVDFYDREAPRFWGLQSFVNLDKACERFRAGCMQTSLRLYQHLEEVAVLLSTAKANLDSHGCALWEALTNLCIDDPAIGEVRILVFPSDSRKRLFLFAMLARHNLTEDDLREMRTYVVSLNELRRWMSSYSDRSAEDMGDLLVAPKNAVWRPVLVGLPSPLMTPKLSCALLHPNVDVVLYPHQCASFLRRQAGWSSEMGGNMERNVNTLCRLSGLSAPDHLPAVYPRIVVSDPYDVDVETAKSTKTVATGEIWAREDAVSEVSRLFQHDEDSLAEEFAFSDQAESVDHVTDTSEDVWCAEVVKVDFDHGWHCRFAEDAMINVVRNGSLDERYVRSLRVGERVVLIHGQQRQSLYDLIISRVHKHPSIELHLAMIRRWQEDLRVAFEQWQVRAPDADELGADGFRDLSGLLKRMRGKGSRLVSVLTLSFWLRGFVLCPLDSDDLRRVAEVLDMGFVRQHYKYVAKAANRLRGLHRGLSLKLNRWLENNATGTTYKSDDDMIDSELGLTFGDVQNSLMILSVTSVESEKGPFLRSNLGRAERNN